MALITPTEDEVKRALEDKFKGGPVDGNLRREICDVLYELLPDHHPSFDINVTLDKKSGTMNVSVHQCS